MELSNPTEYTTVDFLMLARDSDFLVRLAGADPDGNPDPGVLQWAVNVANSHVDLSIKLPAGSPIEPALNLIANKFAIYHLATRFGGSVDETVQRDYDTAAKDLLAIVAAGSITESETAGGPIEGNKDDSLLDTDIEGMSYVV